MGLRCRLLAKEKETPKEVSKSELKAEKKNGVYILTIQKAYQGYVVMSDHGQRTVSSVNIHGKYFGVDERAEIECDDFKICDGELSLSYQNETENKND